MARILGQAHKKEKINCLVRRIVLISLGGVNVLFILLKGTSSGNILGVLYQKVPIVLKDTRFGENLKHLSVRRVISHCEIHYTYMFLGKNIC